MERQGGSVDDPRELTFMLGELYALKRRDAQIIEQLTSQRDALEERVAELERETGHGQAQ